MTFVLTRSEQYSLQINGYCQIVSNWSLFQLVPCEIDPKHECETCRDRERGTAPTAPPPLISDSADLERACRKGKFALNAKVIRWKEWQNRQLHVGGIGYLQHCEFPSHENNFADVFREGLLGTKFATTAYEVPLWDWVPAMERFRRRPTRGTVSAFSLATPADNHAVCVRHPSSPSAALVLPPTHSAAANRLLRREEKARWRLADFRSKERKLIR